MSYIYSNHLCVLFFSKCYPNNLFTCKKQYLESESYYNFTNQYCLITNQSYIYTNQSYIYTN